MNYCFPWKNLKGIQDFLERPLCEYKKRQQANKLADWLDIVDTCVQKPFKLPD